jgi:hypothetical protein
MNETDARHVMLVRAFEAPMAPPWTELEAEAATREASREQGEQASDDRFLAARGRIAAARLAAREPGVGRMLAVSGRTWLVWVIVLAAFAIGVASDAIGAPGRINILAPPLLAVMAWNLLVYVGLVLGPRAAGTMRTAVARALQRAQSSGGALGRYGADWARVAQPLHGARAAAALHAGAAALVLGMVASLYLRGLAFEYRAGWESTFLGAQQVHALLSIVLGPASRLTGIGLPDAAQIEALRAPGGENAARWIHLYAVTAALVVLLPRGLLALAAAWRARRLAADLPLPLADAYFRRLLNARSGRAAPVHVVPYSYELPAELRPGLQRALERHLGTAVVPSVAVPVPQGEEERISPPPPDAALVALLALTATPERETHGRFVQALAGLAGDAARLTVLVDESGFRLRFGSSRLAERRDAWQRMLGEVGHAPVFADLS